MTTKHAILGAGNGGLSMAGDLILHGHTVSGIYDRFSEMIDPIRQRGGIEMVGYVLTGFAPVDNATTDMARAVAGADVITVVTPAFAHEWIAQKLARHLVDGQTVVLTPGYPGGTLLFRKTLQANGLRAEIDLAETSLIPYATRIVGPASVGIKAVKDVLWIAALPATRTAQVLETLKPALPQLEPLANVLEVGLNCINPFVHAPTAILNWARMEQDKGDHHFDWKEWVTPTIRRIEHLLDEERRLVVEALGLRYYSHDEAVQLMYHGRTWPIVPLQGEVPKGSKTIPPRYVEEDIPMGLVAFASFGQQFGVSTPVMDLLIDFASLLKDADYRRAGRTMERLGIMGMDQQRLLALVNG